MPNIRSFPPGNGPEGGSKVKLPKKIEAGTDIVAMPDKSEAGADIVATPADWVEGADPVKPHEQKKLRKREPGSPKIVHVHEKPPEQTE